MFVEVVKHYVTKRTVREKPIEAISKKIKLNVHAASKEEQKIFNDFKDEVEEKLKDLRRIDKVHNQDYTTGVEIKKWDLIQCAVHQVAYGDQLFGKIDIGNAKFMHVRYSKLIAGYIASRMDELNSIPLTLAERNAFTRRKTNWCISTTNIMVSMHHRNPSNSKVMIISSY
jgi:hypothetical protein